MFENIFNTFLKGLGSDFFGKAGNVITAIAPIFSALFGVYVVIVAWNGYNRGFDENIMDMFKRMAAWLIIISCAFNASQYVEFAQTLYTLPEFLSEAVNGQPYNGHVLDGEVDKFLDAVSQMFGSAMSATDMTDIGTKLMIGIMHLLLVMFGYAFFGTIAAFYLVSKLSLAMVLIVGPIFIGSMLFPATRQWGMNWIGQVLNYGITIMFYVVLAAAQLEFYKNGMESSVNALSANIPSPFSAAVIIPLIGMYFFATIVFIVAAINVPSIASALTGGASISGLSTVARGTASTINGIQRGVSAANHGRLAMRHARQRGIAWAASKIKPNRIKSA